MKRPGPGGTGEIRTAGRARSGAIAFRLALAFAAVALVAVGLLGGLTAAFASSEVSHLAMRQRAQLTGAVAVAAAAAYDSAGGWHGADLVPVLEAAARAGADTRIEDRAGRVVAVSPGFAASAGSPEFSTPVVVRGQRAGRAVARFSGSGFAGADYALLTALLRALTGAATLAALLALATGLLIARRITRPVQRLITVARAREHGDRGARAGPVRAPRELRDLAAAFDQMADSLGWQEQLRRNLVADVAHELRTPVAILQAGHEALCDRVTTPGPAELASLREEVLRLARMVDDLQTLAAAESAALRLVRTGCDLADVAGGAAGSVAGRFRAAGVTLERHLNPVPIVADPGRLHQVVTNLLTNALKFTPAGGRVTIVTRPEGGSAVLTVTDTGTGIPPGEMPHIFDRFWRGEQATHTTGSGIGLAVAAELARAHGGDLSAASEPGRGTEMRLTLARA